VRDEENKDVDEGQKKQKSQGRSKYRR